MTLPPVRSVGNSNHVADHNSIVAEIKARQGFNVKDYGAVGDGVTSDTTGIQAAIDAANTAGGGIVYFPKGRYRVPSTTASLVPKSNTVWSGAGAGSVLWHDSTSDTGSNALVSDITDPGPSNWTVENLTIEGSRGVGHYSILSGGPQLVYIAYADNVTFRNVTVQHARYCGIVIEKSSNVLVDGCTLYKLNGDGIRLVDVNNARVVNNYLRFVNDDAISAHTNNATTVPLRTGVVISNNTIEDSQGIKVLGPKSVTITGNTLRRIMSLGICVGQDTAEGVTAGHSLVIANNTIQDVFLRQEVPPRNGLQAYILILGSPRAGTTAALAPGLNNTATGAIVSPFGATTGSMYSTSATDQPGAYNYIIANNVLTRTLPAVTTWSQWGRGSALEVGDVGTFNGAITEAAMNTRGIEMYAFLRNALISNNIISTTGDSCIMFREPAAGSVDREYDDVLIEGNLMTDWKDYALYWVSATTTYQNITLRRNKFDGDPRLVHANRGTTGTWAAASTPYVLWASSARGLVLEDNDVRNVCQVFLGGASFADYTLIKGNLLRADPAAAGFSTSNKGIGNMPLGGAAYTLFCEGSDPTAADFREVKNACVTEAASIPTTGKYMRGHFVANTSPTITGGKVTLGWMRAVTGTAHVSGTDWNPLVVPNT